MPTPESDILALIKLLADDHPEIVEVARKKLAEFGTKAALLLEEAALKDKDPKIRVEARGVLEQIRLVSVAGEWQGFSSLSDEKLDLEKGVFLLSRVSYPDVDSSLYGKRLDGIADQIRPELKKMKGPTEQLALVNRILFQKEGFRGNRTDYFDPQNSYLNRVMDRKLGIPISLSVLYLLVAQRLKLPLKGAGIPGHFMVKYQDTQTQLYIDPFNEGRFLTRPECAQFIVEAGYPYQLEFLEGMGAREILARMLRNLILIYVDRQEETLERTLSKFLDLLYPRSS